MSTMSGQSFRRMERVITQLSGLTAVAEAVAFTNVRGINNGEDLLAITFEDVTFTLGTATIVKY